MNAEDTPLNQAIGTAWMIAAVRRVRQPGCKFDAILTLQSDQGTGKSTFFRILASDAWINDSVDIGASSKEVIENTAGSWILEHAELSKLNNREVEDVKKFATIREDRARTAWGRIVSRVPRQFVCGATVNRAAFLKDDTGNRRFWVAAVGKTREVELSADRDQLWAEAAHLEAKGVPINIPEELWPAAAEVADKHMKEDPVADEVVAVLSRLPEADAIVLARDLARAIGVEDVTKRGGQVAQSIATGARRASWTNECGRIPGLKTNGSLRYYSAPRTGGEVRVYMFEKSQGVFSLFRNGRFVEQQRGTPEAEL
jgi:predicted P-loop ATPase